MFKVICVFVIVVVSDSVKLNFLSLQCVHFNFLWLSISDSSQFCVFTAFSLHYSDRIVVYEKILKALQKKRNFIHVEVHAEFLKRSYWKICRTELCKFSLNLH